MLERLRTSGITLTREGNRLKVAGPPGALTADLKGEIADRKAELLRLLSPVATTAATIKALEPRTRRPLSPNQERLWSLISHEEPDGRYNLPFALRIRGPLDLDRLRRAVARIVERHQVLRSAVRTDESGAWLEPTASADVVTVEAAPAGADDDWINERLHREAEVTFDLEAGRAVRVLIVVLGAEDHLLNIVMHHFVADGTSFEVFFDELSSLYASEKDGQARDLAPLPIQYHDFAAWRHRQLTPERRRRAEGFWRQLYEDNASALRLPRRAATGHAHHQESVVPESTMEGISSLAAAEATSPFVVAFTAYGMLMAKLTDSTDVVLCSPAAGREAEEVRGLIGYFNNVLPLRLRIDPDAPARYAVRASRQVVLEAHEHQLLPFQDIASLTTTRRLALTRGMFVYHGRPIVLPRLEGVQVEALPVTTRTVDFDVGLSVLRSANQVVASLDCAPGALGTVEPSAFLDAYLGVLDRLVDHPDLPHREIMRPVALTVLGPDRRPPPPTLMPEAVPPGESSGLPEDPLELQLTVIWERVLEVRGIGPTDNFFDLGGHSLLAVQLLELIEREMGRRFDLAAVLRYPTVQAQAHALRSEGWSPPAGSLIPMYALSRGDPVVLLHSFEGHTFLFNELAQRLGRHVPTYGLQAQGLGDGTPPHSTVEEMAGHYLDELERHFGDAPVAIVGMCFGNSVGLEMATRRAAAGNPVELILIDGAWEHLQQPEDRGPPSSLVVRVARRMSRELQRWRWMWDTTRRRVTGSPYARREAAIRDKTIRAWNRYTPRPYPGRITLIRAQDTADNPSKDWHVRAMGWIAQGGLHTVTVPGHHFTILREPHVAEVANAVLEAAPGGFASVGSVPRDGE